ncbi:hypothetical protein HY992_01215 [Candidatus Micrarchaeota archaeon]|nr:hypothetical protein [Candidatus Micrarchaeota archaeon]
MDGEFMDAVHPLPVDAIFEMNFRDPNVTNKDFDFVLTVFGVSRRNRAKAIRERNAYFGRKRDGTRATRSKRLDEREPLHKAMMERGGKTAFESSSRSAAVKIKK